MLPPFLRWAGGKRFLLSRMLRFLPIDVVERRYHEPFLGAGAMFFALQPKRACLSDANAHLMQCLGAVRNNPHLVYRYLSSHVHQSTEAYYYSVRKTYNRSRDGTYAQAARFIYLNRACFNGIFRVNTEGDFNVPYGRKEPPPVPERAHLVRAGKALRRVSLSVRSFEDVLSRASPGDFVYLDPPYPPLNGTAYFTHYTADRFDRTQQRRVAEIAQQLHSRRCYVMVTNANLPFVRRLYSGFSARRITVTRYITCKARKHSVDELILTNYRRFHDWGALAHA